MFYYHYKFLPINFTSYDSVGIWATPLPRYIKHLLHYICTLRYLHSVSPIFFLCLHSHTSIKPILCGKAVITQVSFTLLWALQPRFFFLQSRLIFSIKIYIFMIGAYFFITYFFEALQNVIPTQAFLLQKKKTSTEFQNLTLLPFCHESKMKINIYILVLIPFRTNKSVNLNFLPLRFMSKLIGV